MRDSHEKLLGVITYVLGFAFVVLISIMLSDQDLGDVDILAFIGALLGGAITLAGVYYTIRGSFEALQQQIKEQIKNEEENRFINQLPALIKIRYELNKIKESFQNAYTMYDALLNFTYNGEVTDEDEIKRRALHAHYKVEPLDEENWKDIGLIEDVDFHISLIELKNFYSEIQKILSFNIEMAKAQRKAILSRSAQSALATGFSDPIANAEISQLELSIQEMTGNKEWAWKKLKEKDYVRITEDHLEIIDTIIESIKEFKEKRRQIRDGI
jgi:hypothetical protein